jgi:hypothetical protein
MLFTAHPDPLAQTKLVDLDTKLNRDMLSTVSGSAVVVVNVQFQRVKYMESQHTKE